MTTHHAGGPLPPLDQLPPWLDPTECMIYQDQQDMWRCAHLDHLTHPCHTTPTHSDAKG